MMSKRLEISVGAFVIAGILALVVLAFNVSGLSFTDKNQSYILYARFENLSGLSERAKVSLSGVTIGRVISIELDTENYVAVVKMAIDRNVPLTTDTAASILTAGLLGEKYIGLSVGADEETLMNLDAIEDTQSSMVLEELIGQFLFSRSE
jgi:phospholipid/cholesterol/gamma-HCH transport system substrate-binding protein